MCSSGTYNPTAKKCDTCTNANGSGLNSSFTCGVCPSADTYDTSAAHGSTAAKPCAACLSGYAYSTGTGKCTKTNKTPVSPSWVAQSTTGPAATNPNTPTPILPTTVAPALSTPSTGVVVAPLAVQNTCKTGILYNYSNPGSPTAIGPAISGASYNPAGILDYPAIPNAYKVLTNTTIANESAVTRGDANVIAYKLKITPDGLLSFSYSYNGGAYQSVLAKQKITDSNGPLPNSFQFGFAGSTGGSTNVHEILCFQATPSEQASTSIGLNAKQAAKIANGTQAYLASYYPSNWTGSLTANDLLYDAGHNVVSISNTANWDASCVLTGVQSSKTCVTTGASGPLAAQAPANRNILSWDGAQGIPFQWANLTASQQSALDSGDSSSTNVNRLNYLRGDRSNEVDTSGLGLFRPRESVLGDIVDSSPTWVGPPSSPYALAWNDALHPTPAAAENSGTQSYAQFKSSAGIRLNVVYAGANDGLLHGFRAGSYDSNNNYVNNSSTPNDGHEVLAYMPGAVISGKVLTSGGSNVSVVDTIHGTDPTNSNAVDSTLDYSSTQYGHNFYIDAAPGTGDLFYGGTWHTWAVGGFGPGGAAIYALDVTDPSTFSESNAPSLVMGEWTAASIACANVTRCGKSLGNTYGQPVIRRLHNGGWGAIFGNGFGSFTGDAGIYVMTVSSSGTPTFYYLSTGTAGNNGIAYVYPADLDGDRVIDYVYAGDLLGNVWRFDLTDSDPANWAPSATPLFSTPSGQPITTKVVVWITEATAGSAQRLMVDFGTGQKVPITNTSPVKYASGTQSLYGIWDWDMDGWNSISTNQYASLTAQQTIVASGAGQNLQAQTATLKASGELDGTSNPVCWAGSATCTGGPSANAQFGWEMDLPGSSEQVVYNPVPYKGAFIVNTLMPATNSITSCSNLTDSGNTIAISASTGGVVPGLFPGYRDAIGFRTDGSGSVTIVNGGGHDFLLTQSSDGRGQQPPGVCLSPGVWSASGGCTIPINPQGPTGKRLTWIKKR
jgi:type IV pilus assembly protein PilY1